MASRCRWDRYPRALAFAAWTRLLMPSRIPFAMPEWNHRKMPASCRLMVLAVSMMGGRRECVPQKYHFFREALATSGVGLLECRTSLVSTCGFQISAAQLAEVVVHPAEHYPLQTASSPIICIILCGNNVRVEFIQPPDIDIVSGCVHVTQHLGPGGETLAPFPVRQNSFQCEIAIGMTFGIQTASRISHACRPDRGDRPPITGAS